MIKFSVNEQVESEEIEIEYRSRCSPLIAHLHIDQVFDVEKQKLISFAQAINEHRLDLETFSYWSGSLAMPIHQAFHRGLILGHLRTSINEPNASSTLVINEQSDSSDYDQILASLTNMVNSLTEFRNTIRIDQQCQLTSDGYIRHRTTGRCYLLTQAAELNLISIEEHSTTNENQLIPIPVDQSRYSPVSSLDF